MRNQEILVDKKLAVFHVVSEIPSGKVATYGQVARLAGLPGLSRFVGFVLKNLPKNSKLPWHRVINSQLKISDRSRESMQGQKEKLVAEGIKFNENRVMRNQLWLASSC